MVSWFLEQFGALERQEAAARQVAPEVLLEELLNADRAGRRRSGATAFLESGAGRNWP